MNRYYELTTGNVVTSNQLYLVYEIITGKKFPSDIEVDLLDDMINLQGIKKELENPTPILLVDMHQYQLAIELYMEMEQCDYNTAAHQIENIKRSLSVSDNGGISIDYDDYSDSDITDTFESIINGEEHIDDDFDFEEDIPEPKSAYEKFLREYEAENPPIYDTEEVSSKTSRTPVDPAIIKARQERAASRDASRQARKERREKEKQERMRKLQMQASFLD